MSIFGRFLVGSSSDATRGNATQCIKLGTNLPFCAAYLAYLAVRAVGYTVFQGHGA